MRVGILPYALARVCVRVAAGLAILGIIGVGGAGSVEAAVTSVALIDGRLPAQEIDPPPSVQLDDLFNGANVFEEVNGYVLPVALQVDIAAAGIPGAYAWGDDLSPGVIPAGTRISSALAHFDLGNPDPDFPVKLEYLINFDEDILGVIVSDELLDLSDPIVGFPGTLYPLNLDQRGTTRDIGGGDKVTVGFPVPEPARIVFIESSVDFVLDQVRIITRSPIPEPASLAIAGLAVAAFAFLRIGRRAER